MLFVDSSALAKLFLDEAGSDSMRRLWEIDVPAVASWITYAETRAAIAAAGRSRRLEPDAQTAALRRLELEWGSLTGLVADEETCRAAGVLVERHGLRGADGVQLAAALPFRDARVLFVTFDLQLAQAARAEGLAIAGVSLG